MATVEIYKIYEYEGINEFLLRNIIGLWFFIHRRGDNPQNKIFYLLFRKHPTPQNSVNL